MSLLKNNRKIFIGLFITLISVFLIGSIFFGGYYFKKSQTYISLLEENANATYQVILKDNNYFNNTYVSEGSQYISDLISYINAEFEYSLNLAESGTYMYEYQINANVDVIDNVTNRTVYNINDKLIAQKFDNVSEQLHILKNVIIDYNKYNDAISEFVKAYNLNTVTSKLTVSMQVGLTSLEGNVIANNNVINIEIPLTENTIPIDTYYDTLNISNIDMITSSNTDLDFLLVLSCICLGITVLLSSLFVVYFKLTQTDEGKYNSKLNKILNNYGTYISRVEDEFDMSGYQILRVKNFVDLLEVRDTMHIPIIMVENKESLVACFLIPTSNNILYFYSFGLTQYALPVAPKNEDVGRDKYEEEKV